MASAAARGRPQGAGLSHARVPPHSPVGPIASPASEVEAAIPPRRRNFVIKLRAEPRPAAEREKCLYLSGPLPHTARAQSEGLPGEEGKWRGRSAGGGGGPQLYAPALWWPLAPRGRAHTLSPQQGMRVRVNRVVG